MNDNKKNNWKKILLIIFLFIVLVLGVAVGYSAAYFTATVINSSTPSDSVVTTANMAIEFTDGPQVGLENTVPGNYVTKTFSVKNTGNVDTYYDIYMSDLINTFVDKNDLVFTLTSNTGGASVTETVVPSASTKIVSNQKLDANAEHYYTLRIDFKETNDNQDDNTGKSFSTIIRVNEFN